MLWERHAVLQEFGTPEALANWHHGAATCSKTKLSQVRSTTSFRKSTNHRPWYYARLFHRLDVRRNVFHVDPLLDNGLVITGALGGRQPTTVIRGHVRARHTYGFHRPKIGFRE